MKRGAFGRFLGGVFLAAGLTALTIGAGTCAAYDLPLGLNLGATSFLDGGPPAGPGFYFQQYFQYYNAGKLANQNGGSALPAGTDTSLNALVSISQFLYQSNQDVFLGGKWGVNLMIPVVAFLDIKSTLGTPAGRINIGPADNGEGLGDILIGPFLQWEPIMGSNGPIFMHRFEFQMLLPTGKYDSQRELNPGSNYFSINPYWAGTFFFTPKWTASWRIHYLWNAHNDDPNRGYAALGANNTQAGQAVHLNFASDYEIIEKTLRLGINGYYLKQITDTRMNGDSVPDTREQVFGIGPGAVYHYSQNTHFFFNVYFETAAENRPEGYRLNLRWVQHF